MRKISLAVSLVALLAASPAFALDENYSKIDQVEDAGTISNSTVDVSQTGKVGFQNKSTIRQDGTKWGVADVTQVNTGQTNESDIQQSGKHGTAIVEQNINGSGTSGNNYSQILQHGTGNANHPNMASVSQEGNVLSNTSFIDQNGKKLTATVNQSGTGNTNYSRAKQVANGSSVTVNQGDDLGGTDNTNTSEIDQFADDSTISVTQGQINSGLHNYSLVAQYGYDNTVIVTQD